VKEAEGKQWPTGGDVSDRAPRKNTTPRHAAGASSPAFRWFPLEVAMCTPHHAFHRPLSFRGGRSLRGKRGRGSRRRHLLDLANRRESPSLLAPASTQALVLPFAAHHWLAGWLAGWPQAHTTASIIKCAQVPAKPVPGRFALHVYFNGSASSWLLISAFDGVHERVADTGGDEAPKASSATPKPPGNRHPTHYKVLGDPFYDMAVVGGPCGKEGRAGARLRLATMGQNQRKQPCSSHFTWLCDLVLFFSISYT
jgi:hypothetical protein